MIFPGGEAILHSFFCSVVPWSEQTAVQCRHEALGLQHICQIMMAIYSFIC